MKFIVFGGGGKVARHFARLASPSHAVVSVVRDNSHAADLTSLGAVPHVLSLEAASPAELSAFFTAQKPDAIVFAAGAGGKGGPERTRAVDYDGAVKVFDAAEHAGVRRLLLVGATDVRDRSKAAPDWYNDESRAMSERMWKAIPAYDRLTPDMRAKYDAEVELHRRTALDFTVVRPGGLTLEPAKGCRMGRCQIGQTSRELVAQTLLAAALDPRTAGLTFDVMDGDGTVESELAKVVEQRLDSWTG